MVKNIIKEVDMNKQFCIISHTHWDREWYQPFENFRLRLVDLIDNLLDVIEEYPDYIFHLDAQTIVLEDYLQIKPLKRQLLHNCIKNGNIIVGPWYVQNDFYLTSGEATIRNLIYGIKLANEFGNCARVGYTPDQFGVISQLPQILRNFNSDSCIFGRGYFKSIYWDMEYDEFKKAVPPAEFIWEGADGTRVLGVHMPYWYNNAQRFSQDESRAVKLIEKIEESFEGITATPYLLLMNGVDHLEAQENILPIIERLNINLVNNKIVKQITMQNYVNSIKEFLSLDNGFMNDNLNIFKGELRNGDNRNLLQNTLSSRIYLKVLNTKAQKILENILEPLYSFIAMSGASDKYPREYFEYLWKLLIQNHPHDSICGCSHEDVHSQMEDRYSRFFNLSNDLLKRGLEFVSNHYIRENINDNDYIITVCNFSEDKINGVVEVDIEIPIDENVEGFNILDQKLNNVEFEIISITRKLKSCLSPINLPGVIDVDSFKVRLYVKDLGQFSINSFVVKPQEIEILTKKNPEENLSKAVFENDYIKTLINDDGTIDIECKQTGQIYDDILEIEDNEDVGDVYNYYGKNLEPITTKNLKPLITKIVDTKLKKQYRLTFNLMLPVDFDKTVNLRNEKTILNKIEIDLILYKDSKWLEFNFKVDNKSENHRLRALINSGIYSDYTFASAPFDVVKRNKNNLLDGKHNGDQPNNGFVDIMDNNKSLAIITEGIYEYKHNQNKDGVIAFTLVRASCGVESFDGTNSSCIREINLRLALMPHAGDYNEAKIPTIQKQFQCGLISACFPADIKKFSSGRAAVQESDIKEVFYRNDKYCDMNIACSTSFVNVIGEGIVITAIKKSENSEKYIIRIYNSSENASLAKVRFLKEIRNAYEVTMEETLIKEIVLTKNVVELMLDPKRIVTISFEE